ncbi:MAG: pirin family protein [Lysobacter sp.]|nr:pirin family protein [Lysobacter sp.]
MQVFRLANARGHADMGWLDSWHTFSFGHYHDPAWMGFGPLRVINEDRVAPGAGFPSHRHANMEILSYVLEGALAHKDDAGGGGVLRRGELQWMSSGHGIEHSEFNASKTEPVHFLQIWIQPDRVNAPPAYAQQAFDPAQRRGRWATLASPDGSGGSIGIRQHAWLHGTLLDPGESVEAKLDPARRYWMHVAQGQAEVDGRQMNAGDAIGLVGESHSLQVKGVASTDILLFDLPM